MRLAAQYTVSGEPLRLHLPGVVEMKLRGIEINSSGTQWQWYSHRWSSSSRTVPV